MKKKFKLTRKFQLPVLLIVFALVIMVSGSLAFYTNQGYKKGVAVTDKREAMFSSNLLEQLTTGHLADSAQFNVKEVTVNSEDTGYVSFTFEIYNYAPNTPTRVNPNDISYNLTLRIVGDSFVADSSSYSLNGSSFVNGVCTTSGLLVRGAAQKDSYKVVLPETAVENGVSFAITAEPANAAAYTAVNNTGLAAKVLPLSATSEAVSVNSWSGYCIEKNLFAANGAPTAASCAAYNYEISGSGKGTLTITWPTTMTIDPFFKEFLDDNSMTYVMGADNLSIEIKVDSSKWSAHMIPFFCTNGALSDWPDINYSFKE